MNLVIDIGNTKTKVGLFSDGALANTLHIGHSNDGFEKMLEDVSLERAIICSVKNELPAGIEKIRNHKKVLLFTAETPVPLKNLYRSAATLGSDRLAAAVGANSRFPGKPTLAIDAGTCLKYNFTTAAGEYLGGAISPGLNMRFKALNAYTDRLPLIEKDEQFTELIGKDTKGSILSGVQEGIAAEVDGIIDRYSQLYPNLHVILTGGDAPFFDKRLKNSIFADPFLVLKGLNLILNHNAK